MGPEQTARLFDRFAQVHAGSGKMQAGVGLGLSICLLYCRAMGGTLSVESAIGRGTTFTVTIPAAVEAGSANVSKRSIRPSRPVAEPATIAQADPDAATPGDLANLVLIIDDDASICELMRRNLGDLGFRTEIASSGEEGIPLAKRLLPSAIILDVILPGIDGWAVLATLKTDPRMASIPIIMASMLDERERGLRAGAHEYVSKPVSGGRLADLLRKHIGERATARLLVVEDDADTRSRLSRCLREQGWEVAEAADAEEALNRLVGSAPDVIILDLMLPGRDGHGVIADIRSNPAWQSIPIIVVTAAELDADARRRLLGQVEKISKKELLGRDDLIREIRLQIEQQRREPLNTVVEQSHA
jgi:CheY-like chemotaxis protein